jgi:hypothetical protein
MLVYRAVAPLMMNVVVKWLAFRFLFGRSRVQISTLRPANLTDLLLFSSVRPGECRYSFLKLGHDLLLSKSFPILH